MSCIGYTFEGDKKKTKDKVNPSELPRGQLIDKKYKKHKMDPSLKGTVKAKTNILKSAGPAERAGRPGGS